MRSALLVILLMVVVSGAVAQDAPVMSRANIAQLQSQVVIDYADAPESLGRLESGGFTMSGDGSRLAVRNRENAMIVWDTQGNVVDVFSVSGADGLPDTILDAAFSADGALLALIVSDGAAYSTVVRVIDDGMTIVEPFAHAPDVPLRVWFDAALPRVWLEVMPYEPGERAYIVSSPIALPGQAAGASAATPFPSAPESDPEAFARIGRIAPPRAITVSEGGVITLWNLETGAVTAQAQVDGLPVFGGLNASASHFAWRDSDIDALHLLDFSTGEDRRVAPLNGAYIHFILVTPAADLILGVHVGGEPVVVAWDTTTGERIDLGAYRTCTRAPDMARVSRDGTTLVIGCDTGLDIWRIGEATS